MAHGQTNTPPTAAARAAESSAAAPALAPVPAAVAPAEAAAPAARPEAQEVSGMAAPIPPVAKPDVATAIDRLRELYEKRTEETLLSKLSAGSSVISALCALAALGFVCWQSLIIAKMKDHELTVARLSLVKLKLETLLRGGSLPLSQQALTVPSEQKSAEQFRDNLTAQLIGTCEDAEMKVAVAQLVDDWISAEEMLRKQTHPSLN